jgi:hypothetical protein
MNISSTTAVQSATADAQAPTSDSLNIRVLKKALDAQAVAAQALIESIPQPAPSPVPAPALATSGSLGTQLNTFA